MSIVIRRVRGVPVAFTKQELCPQIDDMYVEYDVMEAILYMFYRNNSKVSVNPMLEELRQIGLEEDKLWKEKSTKERNKLVKEKLLKKKVKEHNDKKEDSYSTYLTKHSKDYNTESVIEDNTESITPFD